jgi:hypothetical protein
MRILQVRKVRGGKRDITIQLGDTRLDVPAAPGFEPLLGDASRIDIDPLAV